MNGPRLGNQDVLNEVDPHWYKLAAILTHKLLLATGKDSRDKVLITVEDIQAFTDMFPGDEPAIVYYPKGDTITLQLLPFKEAQRKAQQ